MNHQIIAYIHHSEHTFSLDKVCNSYFARTGQNVLVVPFSCPPADYRTFFHTLFAAENVHGIIVGTPHKAATLNLLDRVSRRAATAGSCNVVKLGENGVLEGDVLAGEGFIRTLRQQGFEPEGRSAMILGCGGTGSAVAAALAEAGVRRLRLHDRDGVRAGELMRRLQRYYLGLQVESGRNDAHGMDLVVNATLLGTHEHDPLPTDVERIAPHAWVADAVVKTDTAFLRAAALKGCTVRSASSLSTEHIPLCLNYFGFISEGFPLAFSHLPEVVGEVALRRSPLPSVKTAPPPHPKKSKKPSKRSGKQRNNPALRTRA